MDDLNIPISDDELLEDVMSVRPPRKKDYKVCVCVRRNAVHCCRQKLWWEYVLMCAELHAWIAGLDI